jgi:hypothetical protein
VNDETRIYPVEVFVSGKRHAVRHVVATNSRHAVALAEAHYRDRLGAGTSVFAFAEVVR